MMPAMGRKCRLEKGELSNTKRKKSEFRCEFLLIPPAGTPTEVLPTMGQQSKKIIKRRRRADYVKRKAAQAKLGGLVKKPAVKKADVAKKAPAKKAAAKKAPAKKVAKKVEDAVVETAVAEAAVEEAAVAAVEETAAPEATEEV